ncbi:MAG: cytochrome P450, partial [Chloroflexota bacterium]
AKTMFWDIPKAIKFCQKLIERKRKNPGEDILTGLIEAEEDGERLSEDELIAMLFLLIVAGYETTVHLITNGVQTLLSHPEQLDRLKNDWSLIDSAVEEINRFNGPIHGTKLGYPTEDIELRGVTIPKGKAIMPLLGAANFDPDMFEYPEVFDIGREKNPHLGFGKGIHYCLGAPLARMESRIAFKNLFERFPDLHMAIPMEELEIQRIPGWHRYKNLPVTLG